MLFPYNSNLVTSFSVLRDMNDGKAVLFLVGMPFIAKTYSYNIIGLIHPAGDVLYYGKGIYYKLSPR